MLGHEGMRLIEILYFDSCPGWRGALARVQQIVAESGLHDRVEVRTVPIETEEEARSHRFIGSPTVRIDGQDVEAAAETRGSYGLQCRLYGHGGRFEGLPPVDVIRVALGLAPLDSPSESPSQTCCARR
ncbi:Alkylmercury lyase [Labilithrix luteola]|uniref:Alkylmercury lyase n=1 Tax=Labilithrix luteola TaxID=1391654 RepID=A0A0K1QCW3_9BACT|nr:thioredoxin family protein [Labilithrix luteola]AKV03626.1 Alkylmercury lyase [Labilithrix luteola]